MMVIVVMGIGQKLLLRLMNEVSDIETVSLFCDPSLVSFYEQTGFKKSNSQVVMHRRNEPQPSFARTF